MKRGAPLKRKTPLRQRRYEGADIEREPKPAARPRLKSLRRGTYAGGTTGLAVQKTRPLQHAGYMAAVRALGYCMRCGRACRPQFCHRDEGKGGAIKTDCREGWPGCDACHSLLGGHAGGGRMPKEQRRVEELELGRETRRAVEVAGTWPRTLAQWIDNEPKE
jgi:hypothetical protein